MNIQAIEHIHNSKYCFFFDGYKCKVRVRVARNDTIKKIELIWNDWCSFYLTEHKQILKIAFNDHYYSYYEGIMEGTRGSYEYFFKIYDKDGFIKYLCDEGVVTHFNRATTFLNEFMATYPNKIDQVRYNPTFNGRLFYQIFPDRFASSNLKRKGVNMAWTEEDKIDNNHFMGGDFKGIEQKIPYLSKLGVGSIWLTPIHKSPTAHRYDIVDYFSVDPLLGTIEDFKSLLKTAHKYNINIVMDLVFNHCSYSHPFFQDVVKKGRKSKYYDYFFIKGDKPDFKKQNFLCFGNVAKMTKLNTSNPEVISYFTKVVDYWADLGVDGFRLDVAFEVSHYFWREIKMHLTKKHPHAFFIGEDWLNSHERLDAQEWDSTMNYPFRFALLRYFNEDNLNEDWISDRLTSLYLRYPSTISHNMLNLLDSHDTERFINSIKFNRDLYFIAYAALMFYPGVPEIYYGSEIFIEGKQDPFNRKGMKWDSKEFNGKDYKLFKEIISLYKLDALKLGDVKFYAKNNIAFIERSYKGHSYLLAFHKGNKSVSYNAKNIIISKNYSNKKINGNGFVVSKIK